MSFPHPIPARLLLSRRVPSSRTQRALRQHRSCIDPRQPHVLTVNSPQRGSQIFRATQPEEPIAITPPCTLRGRPSRRRAAHRGCNVPRRCAGSRHAVGTHASSHDRAKQSIDTPGPALFPDRGSRRGRASLRCPSSLFADPLPHVPKVGCRCPEAAWRAWQVVLLSACHLHAPPACQAPMASVASRVGLLCAKERARPVSSHPLPTQPRVSLPPRPLCDPGYPVYSIGQRPFSLLAGL